MHSQSNSTYSGNTEELINVLYEFQMQASTRSIQVDRCDMVGARALRENEPVVTGKYAQ